MKNIFTKIAALMVNSGIKNFKKKMDYNETGGAPLLGICKPVIKAHGNANAKAIYNAVRVAAGFAETGVVERFGEAVAASAIAEA